MEKKYCVEKKYSYNFGTAISNTQLSLPLLCCSLLILDQLCVSSLNFVQRCLGNDSDVVKFISDYCIKYGRSNSCTGKNVMFCMQLYKCNVEVVFSGQMNKIIECHFIRSTDCMHAALANLLFEIIMVRDGVLSLPTWFSRDLTFRDHISEKN